MSKSVKQNQMTPPRYRRWLSLFPHACPPGMSSADIDSYLAHNLMPEHIAAYIDDPRYPSPSRPGGNAIAGYSLAFFPASAADHAELAAAGRRLMRYSTASCGMDRSYTCPGFTWTCPGEEKGCSTSSWVPR